jgi:hypothetical protein
VAAPRIHRKSKDVRRAWERTNGVTQFCAALDMALNASGARRLCEDNGLDYPAPHWGMREKHVEIPEPEERIARDTELDRVKSDRDHFKRQYEAAVKERRTAEDLIAAVVDQCAVPRKAVTMAPRQTRVTKLPTREVVMQLSDWQLGELVRPEESGGNAYDSDVFQQRLDRWQDKVIKSVRNQSRAYAIERGSFAFSGDIVEGHDIYSGQPWSLDMDAARQVVEGGDWFAAAVESVVTSLPDVEFSVYCVPGNHGKPGGRKAGNTPVTLNFDWMLYKWLQRELKHLPLKEFAIEPGGRLLFYQAGHIFLMTHGDEVRGWGGFPYYGLDKAHGKLVVDLETVFKYWLLSHWHQSASLPAGRGARIVNGNAVGANHLSQAAVMGSTAPEQNLLFVSEDFGVGEHAHIFLAPAEFTPPRIYGQAPERELVNA